MKKILDFKVVSNHHPADGFSLLTLQPSNQEEMLPEVLPGQFVQVKIDGSSTTFLRRPISICDAGQQTLTLLVRAAGDGTRRLVEASEGDVINIILPLGNGFPLPQRPAECRPLLIGGGVGTAPLYLLAKSLLAAGVPEVNMLVGARSKDMLLMRAEFDEIARLHVTTDDGSEGVKGLVTEHPVLSEGEFTDIYCCGPAPMMKGVAAVARKAGINCFVSLENMMACGLGACLCCVENTVRGNVCVCTEGPVFNINELTW